MKSRESRRREPAEARTNDPRRGIDPRVRRVLAGFALCALTLLAYSNSFQAGFAFDNKGLLLEVPQIQEATGRNLGLIFQHSYWWPLTESGLYRPFTTLTYLFNYAVLGNRDQAAGYHWMNFILHAGNVLLVYVLALRLVRKFWPSFFIALAWAVHPVLTESVTNMVGRADLLAAMGLLSGFLMYLKSAETTGWRRVAWLMGLVAATTMAVFSKESAVAILGVILLYELTWWKERRPHRAPLFGCLAVLAPLAVMLNQRWYVLAHSPAAEFPFTDNPIAGTGFWQGRLTAIKVISRYLRIIAWPAGLSNDYSYSEIPLVTGTVQDWISWIVTGTLIVGIALLYRRNRMAFFLACFAAVNFVPVSNLPFPTGTIMAERLLYLPSIGLMACFVLAIYVASERIGVPAAPALALCLIAAGLGVRTWIRNLDWRDNATLFASAVQASPNSFKAHDLLARALFESDPSLANLDRVIEQGEKSLAILEPLPAALSAPYPYLFGGTYYLTKGDLVQKQAGGAAVPTPEAAAAYRRGVQIVLRGVPIADADTAAHNRKVREWARTNGSPAPTIDKNPDAYRLLSILYLRTGDFKKALDAGIEARAINPLIPEIHRQVAYVLLSLRRTEDAAVTLAQGVLVTSDPGLKHELANLYQKVDPKSCAISLGPNGAELDASCPIVRRHFCAASAGALKATLEAGRRDLAENEKKILARDYGCPQGPMGRVLPNGPGY